MFIERSDDQGLVSLVKRSTWANLLARGPPTTQSSPLLTALRFLWAKALLLPSKLARGTRQNPTPSTISYHNWPSSLGLRCPSSPSPENQLPNHSWHLSYSFESALTRLLRSWGQAQRSFSPAPAMAADSTLHRQMCCMNSGSPPSPALSDTRLNPTVQHFPPSAFRTSITDTLMSTL